MSSGKPIVRQIAGLSVFPQFLVMGILIVVFSLLVKPFKLALFSYDSLFGDSFHIAVLCPL